MLMQDEAGEVERANFWCIGGSAGWEEAEPRNEMTDANVDHLADKYRSLGRSCVLIIKANYSPLWKV